MALRILPVLTIALLWTTVNAGCPTICECSNKTVSCIAEYLEGVPNFESLEVEPETIDLSGNSIISIVETDFSFDGNEYVQYLNLSDNHIVDINEKAFSELTNVREISLKGNSLDSVPPMFVAANKQLVSLDLSSNFFDVVTPEIYSESLEVLDLSSTKILSFGEANIKYLPRLKILNLSYNRISSIEPTTFDNLPNLLAVDITGNFWQCNQKTIDLFDFLTDTGLTDVIEPIKCITEEGFYQDIYTSRGPVDIFSISLEGFVNDPQPESAPESVQELYEAVVDTENAEAEEENVQTLLLNEVLNNNSSLFEVVKADEVVVNEESNDDDQQEDIDDVDGDNQQEDTDDGEVNDDNEQDTDDGNVDQVVAENTDDEEDVAENDNKGEEENADEENNNEDAGDNYQDDQYVNDELQNDAIVQDDETFSVQEFFMKHYENVDENDETDDDDEEADDNKKVYDEFSDKSLEELILEQTGKSNPEDITDTDIMDAINKMLKEDAADDDIDDYGDYWDNLDEDAKLEKSEQGMAEEEEDEDEDDEESIKNLEDEIDREGELPNNLENTDNVDFSAIREDQYIVLLDRDSADKVPVDIYFKRNFFCILAFIIAFVLAFIILVILYSVYDGRKAMRMKGKEMHGSTNVLINKLSQDLA